VLIEKLLKVALLGSSWVMYLLLALSVVSIATMVERWVFFRRRSDDIDELGEKLLKLLERGDASAARALLDKSRSIEAGVLRAGMRYWGSTPESIEDAIAGEMLRERRELERGMTFMGTLGNNAPFVGLLGTVIGVIIAFQQLGTSQAAASMSAVMGGIAEALIATGVGLFVALPAVVAYNLVQKTIADVEDNVAAIAKDITALMRAGARGPSSVWPPEAEAELVPDEPELRDLAAISGGG
jgi:biopolymer transport protein ExbB/biopolymer transport protein TolQ